MCVTVIKLNLETYNIIFSSIILSFFANFLRLTILIEFLSKNIILNCVYSGLYKFIYENLSRYCFSSDKKHDNIFSLDYILSCGRDLFYLLSV